MRILILFMFAFASNALVSYIPATDMTIHFRDGDASELLKKKRLKELQLAYEAGTKKWADKKSSIIFDSFALPVLSVLYVTCICLLSKEIYNDSHLTFIERGAILIPMGAIGAMLSLLMVAPFAKRHILKKQADIYKQELELFRMNVELEHQYTASSETEELLVKIDNAIAELDKI